MTDFDFQLLSAISDGFTFVIQNQGPNAVGGNGAGLGYGVQVNGTGASIANSVALKFDIHNNNGEGLDSTGVYVNGTSPTVPATNLAPTGVQLASGHVIHAHIVYNGGVLTLTLTDATAKATATAVYLVNIPAVVGGTTAYVGFTAGTGGTSAIQNILDWTYTATPTQITAISPNYGAPAAQINITGTDFGATQGNGSVTVGGAPSYVVSWSNTLIAIQVPSRATTGNIVVTAGGKASNGAAFTFYPYPAITGISPASGPVGTPITVIGTGLLDGGGNAAVTFNGTPATILSEAPNSIKVEVPAGATTGPVSIRVNGDTVKSSSNFTVIAPQITSISQNYGAPSALVDITGNNFGTTQGNGIVTVGGALSYVASWSSTKIAILVPSRAKSGNILVMTAGEASNGEPFTFYPYPAINMRRASQRCVAGTIVTITGTSLLDGGGTASSPSTAFRHAQSSASPAPAFRSRSRLRQPPGP